MGKVRKYEDNITIGEMRPTGGTSDKSETKHDVNCFFPKRNYDPNNDDLCKEPAHMLLFKSEEFCELLYARPPRQDEIVKQSLSQSVPLPNICSPKEIYSSQKREWEDRTTLVGYYIEPKNNLVNTVQDNYFLFHPIFLKEINGQIQEIIGTAQQISMIGFESEPLPGFEYCRADVFAYIPTDSPIDTFIHRGLQFTYLPNIGKAYISRHELLMLTHTAKYIGIVGARVSSGNMVTSENDNTLKVNSDGCNKNYFTYRFVALNEATSIDEIEETLPEDYKLLVRADNRKLNSQLFMFAKLSNSAPVPPHSIPAETWAVPCPPVWIVGGE